MPRWVGAIAATAAVILSFHVYHKRRQTSKKKVFQMKELKKEKEKKNIPSQEKLNRILNACIIATHKQRPTRVPTRDKSLS